jgi:hypothetical protein
MFDFKLCTIPVDLESKLTIDYGPRVQDDTHIRSVAGALQYLTSKWLDVSYAIEQVCLHMHDPREPHLVAIKCIMHYLHGTLELVLLLHRSSTS